MAELRTTKLNLVCRIISSDRLNQSTKMMQGTRSIASKPTGIQFHSWAYLTSLIESTEKDLTISTNWNTPEPFATRSMISMKWTCLKYRLLTIWRNHTFTKKNNMSSQRCSRNKTVTAAHPDEAPLPPSKDRHQRHTRMSRRSSSKEQRWRPPPRWRPPRRYISALSKTKIKEICACKERTRRLAHV